MPFTSRPGSRSADLEPRLAPRLLLALLYVVDIGAARPRATPVDEPLDGAGIALEHRIDAPVVAVRHPPGQAFALGLAARLLAEVHALNVAVDDHPATDHVTGHGGDLRGGYAALGGRRARERSYERRYPASPGREPRPGAPPPRAAARASSTASSAEPARAIASTARPPRASSHVASAITASVPYPPPTAIIASPARATTALRASPRPVGIAMPTKRLAAVRSAP